MKTKAIFLLLWATLVCFTIDRADAGLIEVTDPASPGGVNNVTQDTATGLDWLDLTASGGISYDDITLQFAPSGTYDGWRHATGAEVSGLFTGSAGLTLGNQAGVVDPNATQFVALVGITQSGGATGDVIARGRYNDDASGTQSNLAGSAFVAYRPLSTFFPSFTEASILDDQPVINSVVPSGAGHWLVRATVPEPSALALAALALVGCAVRRRRRRRS